MSKQKKRRPGGRPRGSTTLKIDLEGHPDIFLKPYLARGKWRTRRKCRLTGRLSLVTLEDAESFGDAVQDLTQLALRERKTAEQSKLPPEDREVKEITLAAALKKFLAYLEGVEEVSEAWAKELRYSANVIEGHLGADTLVHSITLERVEEMLKRLGTLSGRTKAGYAALLKRLFAYCERHRHVKQNVLASWRSPKKWRQEIRESIETGQYLSPEEIARLLRACEEADQIVTVPKKYRKEGEDPTETDLPPPDYLHVAVGIAVLAGLRRGNIIGENAITWGDLRLEPVGEETLTIDKSRMKSGREFSVPIGARLAELLRTHRAARAKKLGKPPRASERVIPEVDDLRKSFHSALKRADLAGRELRFHDLRHSYSGLLAATAPAQCHRLLMGHAAATISDRYAESIPFDVLREHVDKVAERIADAEDRPTIVFAEGGPEEKKQA